MDKQTTETSCGNKAIRLMRDRALPGTLALFVLLLTLVAQLPQRYVIDIGREDGPGSDLPLVRGMFPVEDSPFGAFRWTTGSAGVRLPGFGQRALTLTLRALAVNDEVATRGARELELWSSGRRVALLPVRPSGAIYRLIIPPPADISGDHQIEIRSATIIPTGDQRAIGTPLTTVIVSVEAGPALPSWRSLFGWSVAGLMLWIILRQVGFANMETLMITAPLLGLAVCGAWLDPPRFALGAIPALIALVIGWTLVLALRAAPHTLRRAGLALGAATTLLWLIDWQGPIIDLGRATVGVRAIAGLAALAFLSAAAIRPALTDVLARLGVIIPAMHRRWLLLIIVLVFATRYGGKIYPDAMPGDIGFHANRFAETVGGRVMLVSRNRGVDFPYPPAFYLILAPFTLLDIDRRALLHFGAALLDAFSPLLVYILASALTMKTRDERLRRDSRNPFPIPLAAAALYGLMPAGYLTTWWNFSTHIFTQFAHLLLITLLILSWKSIGGARDASARFLSPNEAHSAARLCAALVIAQLLVYLGHFGFWMNTSLLGGFGLAALLATARHRRIVSIRAGAVYGIAFVVAQAGAILLFYSAYTDMFAQQLAATATGGLTGLAGRTPASFDTLWNTLWNAGFRQHYGFFPLALLPAGILWLMGQSSSAAGERRRPAAILAVGTILVAIGFAALPFLSGSTLSTRWLMFSAWIVALSAATGAAALWRHGWAGRAVTLAAGGYVFWVTISTWLAALLWRVRPPEPF
ncbi:MAG: hypothetical protein ACUVSW_03505 [Roseiflexus sp.]